MGTDVNSRNPFDTLFDKNLTRVLIKANTDMDKGCEKLEMKVHQIKKDNNDKAKS